MNNIDLNEEVRQSCLALLNHGVVAFPTETVFGLGVVFDDFAAYSRLNEVKRRQEDKPYTMMLSTKRDIDKYAFVDDSIQRVIDKFVPGSLTLLLKAKDIVPGFVTHNTGVIGIRIPTNIEAISLLKAIDKPLLVPSANRSGEKPGYSDIEVKNIFNDDIDFVISGRSESNIPSTIVDFTKGRPLLIREGLISFEEILRVFDGK